MKTIYCISGLDSDEQVFSRLKIDGYRLVYLPWITPLKDEPINQYAARMADGIKEENPILLGLSFGGMMCMEISKIIPVKMVILISSIRSDTEMPAWMKWSGKLKLNKIIPLRPYRILEPIENRNIGVTDETDMLLVRNYRKNISLDYLEWAVNEILNWDNNYQPPVVYHIHGSNDRIFPIKNVKPTHVVKGAGHLMVFNKAKKVSSILEEILQEQN